MTFRHIECVLMIAESGSISLAAERLLTSQPYLSGMLSALEKELGYPIFERHTKGISLTREGEAFIQSALLIQREWNKIYAMHHQDDSLQIASYFSTFVMNSFLKFQHDYPGKGADFIEEMGNMEVLDAVASHRYKCGIIFHAVDKNSKFTDLAGRKNLRLFTLCKSFRMCAIMSKSHPLAGKDSITMDEFRAHPIVFYDDESSMIYLLDHLKVPRDGSYLSVTNRGRFIDALNSGYYHSCIFSPGAEEHPMYNVIPIRDADYRIEINYVSHKDRQLNEREKRFRDYLHTSLN